MDKEFLGERRHVLEEEYFAKLNRALLKRLHAAEGGNGEAGKADERRGIDEDLSSDRMDMEELGPGHKPKTVHVARG